MGWKVEVTAEFGSWFASLEAALKREIAVKLALLRALGPKLGRPHVDTVKGSRFRNLKELRIKRGQTRVFFAFDPRRVGVLLLGGSKRGRGRFYESEVPKADAIYARHLASLQRR